MGYCTTFFSKSLTTLIKLVYELIVDMFLPDNAILSAFINAAAVLVCGRRLRRKKKNFIYCNSSVVIFSVSATCLNNNVTGE